MVVSRLHTAFASFLKSSAASMPLALAGALCMPIAAQAQDEAPSSGGVADIVVTAQKREQRLQDVPVAVSALTADTLTTNRIQSVRDLDALIPNMTVRTVPGGSGLPNYTIRGLVSQGSYVGSDKGVAVYIDGVYLGASSGSIFDLPSIERIEVLRGPQGTLFGRNSTGGAISITTREPNGEFSMSQTFTAGNRDEFRSITTITTPQWGPFSAVLSYSHQEKRGDVRNLGAGTTWDFSGAYGGKPTFYTSPQWLGSYNTESFFAAVKGDFSDNFNAIYRFDYSVSDTTAYAVGVTYAQPGTRAVLASQPNPALMTPITNKRPDAVNNASAVPARLTNIGHSLTMTYDFSDTVSLKNIASYRKTVAFSPFAEISGLGGLINTNGLAGSTPTSNGFLGAVGLTAATAGQPFVWQTVSTNIFNKQWSDELQLNVDTDAVTATAGLLYYVQKGSVAQPGDETGIGNLRNGAFRVYPRGTNGLAQVPNPGNPASQGGRLTVIKSRSIAAYAQLEGHVTPELDIIGGIRYTKDKKSGLDQTARSNATPLAVFPVLYNDDQITFSVGANYKPNQDVLLYAKYGTGYISGGPITGGALIGQPSYEPEKAKSWEAGIKGDWFDRKLRTNLALFWVDYKNLQLNTTTTGNFPTLPPLGITQILVSAGDARARGFELETTVVPNRNLQLNASVGFTDFKFTRIAAFFDPTAAQKALGAEFLTFQRPKWTVNLSGQYTSEPIWGDATFSARLDANWKSQTYQSSNVPPTGPGFDATEQRAFKEGLRVAPYWIVNGRLALNNIAQGSGLDVTAALWGRNLFNNRSVTYAASLVTAIGASFEQARSYGIDLTVNF